MTAGSGIRDNRERGKAGAFVTSHAPHGSALSVVSAYFTTTAYDRLATTLDDLGSMRFLFGEPRFLKEGEAAGLVPPAFSLEEDGLRLAEQMRARSVSARCARWIRERVAIRSVKLAGLLHGKMIHVDDGRRQHALVGSSNFTVKGLGLGDAPNIELNLVVDGDRDRADLLAWFDELWSDETLTQDVRADVLAHLEALYRHAAPEFVYHKTLLHLFESFLSDQAAEDEKLARVAFEETAVWRMMFPFQRDGLRAVLAKIDRHGGCVLADSVGLGKTLTALGAIKWFEKRNGRVLVLCPKKLRDNWTTYLGVNNSDLNPLRDDRFGYTVLSHTDLSRERGRIDGIDLQTLNWGAYDLVVIDESHNFRNNARGRDGRRSRYERLMDDVVKAGLKTKLLLLSATPVNNDLADLKAQLDLISAGNADGFASLGVPDLPGLVGTARRRFADWTQAGGRDPNALLAALPPALFGLLDGVTIARSRRHIERHYAGSLDQVGPFPTRAAPVSLYAPIDLQGEFPAFEDVDAEIGGLALAIYNPLRFVLPEYRARYDRGGNFDQANREKYLVAMMKTGFLKRLESSVSSFGRTMDRMVARIDARLADLRDYGRTSVETPPQDDELDEETEDALVGGALRYNLAHVDQEAWADALTRDRERVARLAEAARRVTPERDAKLSQLRDILRDKAITPSVNRDGEPNRKLILFTAYAETATYLYDQLLPAARELGLHAGLVTGSSAKASFGREGFADVLVNFAPRAKHRAAMRGADNGAEIDLLIATDCISEGQNLQDADLLVNVDIHWNPVRLIQRFGRIDRIGSRNDVVRMVNFWPTEDLNRYLRLKDRVEARMALVDLSATGEDNLLATAQAAEGEDRWRDQQLLRLRDEVFDLEDAGGGVTLADFQLDDFRADLLAFARADEQALRAAPLGLHAVVPTVGGLEPGALFCLRRRPATPDPDQARINPLDPHHLLYVRDDGTVRLGLGRPRAVLEAWRALCLGHTEPFEALCQAWDEETAQGERLERYDALIDAALASIGQDAAAKTLQSLTGARGGRVPDAAAQARARGEWDLITWLVVKPGSVGAGEG